MDRLIDPRDLDGAVLGFDGISVGPVRAGKLAAGAVLLVSDRPRYAGAAPAWREPTVAVVIAADFDGDERLALLSHDPDHFKGCYTWGVHMFEGRLACGSGANEVRLLHVGRLHVEGRTVELAGEVGARFRGNFAQLFESLENVAELCGVAV